MTRWLRSTRTPKSKPTKFSTSGGQWNTAFGFAMKANKMIRAEQEKQHHAAAHDRDGETSVAQAERKENNNGGTHVPERDFTLPAGVATPHRPLGAEKRKRGLDDER